MRPIALRRRRLTTAGVHHQRRARWPPRSTRHAIGARRAARCRWRGSARAPATRRRSAAPSIASTRSPARRPAAAPARPALTSPSTGSLNGAAEADALHQLASTSLAAERVEIERDAALAAAVAVAHRAAASALAVAAPPCVTCQRRSVSERTSCHSSPSLDYRADPVAGAQAGALGEAGRHRRAEHGLRLVDADPVRARRRAAPPAAGWRAARRRRSPRAARAACG